MFRNASVVAILAVSAIFVAPSQGFAHVSSATLDMIASPQQQRDAMGFTPEERRAHREAVAETQRRQEEADRRFRQQAQEDAERHRAEAARRRAESGQPQPQPSEGRAIPY